MVCLALAGWITSDTVAMGQDSAASEALFNKGVADMEAGKYETACPALVESQRLDPRAGTVYTLAECEAKAGKIASAVAHYNDYVGMVSRMSGADLTRHRDREKASRAQVEKLRPLVPLLTLVLPDPAPKGTAVKRDGVVLTETSLGVALPVDPGEHTIATQAPGAAEHVQRITIGLRDNMRVQLQIELPKAISSASPSVSSAPVSFNPGGAAASTPPPPASGTSAHTWTYLAGGIGVVGLGVGTVTGLMSMSKKKTVDSNCE